VKCPRCRGYVFATEDGWGTALRCLHCGWERDVTRRAEAVNGATPRALDGERPSPLWETYCTVFPWEDWVRLAQFGGGGRYDTSQFRLRGPGRQGG
jgi:hypothetical protein